jgi:hypothetical protein
LFCLFFTFWPLFRRLLGLVHCRPKVLVPELQPVNQ